ncbi:flagellar hook-length control protein FliK [Paraglaciecola psychrophila]|uniref:Flagellar hook-length control protein-like C-terminal domain-containing protein n=1 Tax=Paraglaciecola psychrophila 170 TaxID=1129794 RepID=K7A4Z8_9ALTE|nr:flagellar hook-length control protein FliK [Paraglaciecola psychrophila]AGH43716.1 hypothetical protein C427_1607 [Paraglaciecola psychrophila 170]GAC35928.1 hypothetical protein GPSY_0286 [Paraglaciecola psychrophila 170]
MPDISQSSQATISQALTQLSQVASTSDVARKGVDVFVKQLAGNVLSLSKNTVLLNKVALLNNPQISGKLLEGQTHQVKLTLGNNPSLEFFSQTSAKTTTIIPLTEQQLQSLLRLPAKQLVSGNLLANSNLKNILPVINATVLSVLSKEQLKTLIPTELLKLNIGTNPLETKNTVLTKQQHILTVSLTEQRPPLALSLPLKQLNQFSVGEKVTLAIVPKGNHWQLTIQQNTSDAAKQSKNNGEGSLQLKSPQATSALSALDSKVTKDQQNILTSLLASPLIKASLQQAHLAKPINFELAIKSVLQQLSKINNEQSQGLLQKLQALPIDKLTLQIKPNGEIELQLQNTKPVANIPVTKEIAQALAVLKLPNQQAVDKRLNLSIESTKQTQTASQVPRAELNLNIQKPGTERYQHTTTDNKSRFIVPPVDGSKSQEVRLSMKEAGANLLAEIQQGSMTQSVISPSLLTNKPEQINLVQSLLRIVQAKAEAPAITLQSIEKALVDVEFFKGATEQSSKQLVEQVLQQIKQALPQGKEQDVNQIRQLLTTPALNLSALQMINPASSQGFMSGLVTLLQMSLSARLARNQSSSRTDQITTTLNSVLGTTRESKPKVTSKAMNEMSQLEQKHQLMKEIGRLLSGHQANKLSNAEQMIQGQETFYYNLPSALGGTIKDIELLIKREQSDKENTSSDEKNNKTWQLTMKLAVGDLGELLTKAKLRANTLEINFYTSNDTVKIQVMNYLPLLRRKLDSLGIEVSKSQCQLGKIPDTLQQRPYHMFQAKA